MMASTTTRTPLPRLAHGLRAIGVLIMLGGVIDPSFTRARSERPTVAVVASDSVQHATLLAAVRSALSRTVTVTGAVHAQDAARVVVGDAVPASLARVDSAAVPTFVVSPRATGIVSLEVPTRVSQFARVSVTAQLTTHRGNAARTTVQLRQQDVVLDQDTITLDAERPTSVTLSWTPAVAGVQTIELRVIDATTRDSTRLQRAVVVDSARWRVLSYDARPSYLSTFVRRAIERDARFAVTSRVVTANTAQQRVTLGNVRMPESLVSLDGANADVVLVGAPEALGRREVESLHRAMRVDGVSVVLLPDHAVAGPVDALVASGGWRTLTQREPVRLRGANAPGTPADSLVLRALAVGTPARLPLDAEPLLVLDDATAAPVVWRQPLGAGELVVSGAFDAWRYRDAGQSTFQATWRDLVAASAARRAPNVMAIPDHLELAPGERAAVVVRTRGGASVPTVSLDIGDVAPAEVAVHRTARADEWLAVLHAPPQAGTARAIIRGGRDARADSLIVPVLVAPAPERGLADQADLMRAWARAHGGAVLAAGDLATVSAQVLAASRAQPQRLPWRPMRSPWWIVPLTLALAGDWWLRRRRGWR